MSWLKSISKFSTLLLFLVALASCKSYKSHLMFQFDETYSFDEIDYIAGSEIRNYVLQPNDFIRLEVFTKDGERIIDPDFVLNRDIMGTTNNNNVGKPDPLYLIIPDSTAKLPMVGNVKLGGLTVNEANIVLEERFEEFYKDSYVLLEYTNKRVVVLGGVGGKVIPLQNENMSVTEILALAGGLEKNMRAENIRLIRRKQVFLIDLSSIDGYQKTNMMVESGDIIYVEPIPRVITQSAAEISLIVGTITALATLVLLFRSI